MRKSVKREYELDRTYDYADAWGYVKPKNNVGYVKKRARRRLRRDDKNLCQEYNGDRRMVK
jgi:hypothetical protein